jgi:hypothetical protein
MRYLTLLASTAVLCSALGAVVTAEELPAKIDDLVTKAATGPLAGPATDSEFLRRATLDLIGTIPSPTEARAFLADASPNKRTELVDRLLADPRYAIHWAEALDVMLMERRPDKHIPRPEWLQYLQTAVLQNRSWGQLAHEILAGESVTPELRPAAKFYLDRDAEPNLVTRDVGRVFLGIDLQCAQCHDHPLVSHYAQSDYYGLYAFVSRTRLFNDEAQKKVFLAEVAEGEADYKSVFTGDASRSRPRLPGSVEVEDVHFRLGDEYTVEPADKMRSVPKRSHRQLLAQTLTSTKHPLFAANFANRMWALLLGRGLVHPVDMHHPQNPATNPELLALLSQEFEQSGYDMKRLLRAIVLSQTYQRSAVSIPDPAPRLAIAAEEVARREAALAALKATAAAANDHRNAAYEAVKTAHAATAEVEKAWQAAVQAAIAARKPVQAAQVELAKTQSTLATKQPIVAALQSAHQKTVEAQALLTGDAEVTQAVTVLQNKLAATTAEVDALQKKVVEQTAAVEAAKPAWVAAVDQAEAKFTELTTAGQPWETAKQQLITARNEAMRADATVAAEESMIQRWKQLSQVQTQRSRIAELQTNQSTAQTAMQSAEAAVTQLTAVVAEKTAAATAASDAVQAATAALAKAEQLVQEQQAVAAPVAQASAQTEAALVKLAGDPELTDIAAKLKARLEPLASAVQQAQQAATEQAGKLEATKAVMVTAQQELAAAQTQLEASKTAAAAAKQAVDQAISEIASAQNSLTTLMGELEEVWSSETAVRGLKPLTPEQLAWATFEATGIMDGQRQVADAEIEKTIPKATADADPAIAAKRAFEVARKVREQMAGNAQVWVTFYGSGAGQPQDQFFATADQALFLGNAGYLRGWIPAVSARATAFLNEPDKLVDELSISILTRPATPAEVEAAKAYLAGRTADAAVAVQELAWAMLASAEFRFHP